MTDTRRPKARKFYAPWWIYKMHRKLIPRGPRDLYTYLCVFGPESCWLWNWRLAKKFGVTKRTIRRWLKWLKDENLIHISKPFGKDRKIHPHYYGTPEAWLVSTVLFRTGKTSKKIKYHRKVFEQKRQRNIQALLWNSDRTQGGQKCPP